jgi:hypothetical protein
MRNVLSTRLVRLVLDEWREMAFRERIRRFSESILYLRTLNRIFSDWHREWLCQCFSTYMHLRRQSENTHITSHIFHRWYHVSAGLRRNRKVMEAVVFVNRVTRVVKNWVLARRSRYLTRRKMDGVRAIHESRLLLHGFTAWIDAFRQRPMSLRFRLNLPSFMKYVDSSKPRAQVIERGEVSLSRIPVSTPDLSNTLSVFPRPSACTMSSTLRIDNVSASKFSKRATIRSPSLLGLRKRLTDGN